MRKFRKTLRGYNPGEVNSFLDEVIERVEGMVFEIKSKNKEINNFKEEIRKYQEQIDRYKNIEKTLNKTIILAQDNGEQIRRIAKQESNLIIEEARKNANRIVNEALLRAERIEYQASTMRKNISLFKRKLRSIIETQLEMVDDIEIIDV